MKIMKLFYDGEYAADCENKMNYVKLLWSDGSINNEDVMSEDEENYGKFPYIIKIAKKIKENSENEYEYVKKYARFEEINKA